jgi:valyl-tRNA synthetase
VIGQVEVYLPLAGLIDLEGERRRLENELKEIESQIQRLEQLLASPFAQKAPPAIVQKEREKLAAFVETKEKLSHQLNTLG